MTTYSFGDTILIGFPHTNLQTILKRPTIILYDSGDKDVLAARISTQEHKRKTDHKIIKWKKNVVFLQNLTSGLESRQP